MGDTISVGGQAVIEGVMMMTPSKIATAVRKESGEIILNVDNFQSLTAKYRFFKWPFIRGIISLFEMMVIGMKTLTWSANQQEEDDGQLSSKEIAITIGVAILASILIFVLIPYGLTYVITANQGLLFNLIDGVFRLLIFVIYISGISLMKDIGRIFQYHGAEHKTVNCFEQGKELTPENVVQCSRIHPRCGTSLIVFVLGLSIVLFSVLKSPIWWINIAWRILLIPVIAGISYEVIKYSAKHMDNSLLRWIIKPGLLTQEITTRNPSKEQCEVAIKALKAAV
ncbi:DUF1385 domain-containing protein [Candidatus Woesearchaeota archaeon]|nr:DUF1385 domain-containing protein [Candidatus Woesearchaeota archaeon]